MFISSTPISSGLRSSPTVKSQSLNILMSLSFTFFIYILHLCRIDLWMLHRLSRFLTCHNDVIDAGHNNRLSAPGTYMDWKRLRLSHMENGTYYVQICDKRHYHIFCCNMFGFACSIIAKSQCWLFAHWGNIRICPRIQLPAYAYWSQRLFVKSTKKDDA